jgi:hypothetical protein
LENFGFMVVSKKKKEIVICLWVMLTSISRVLVKKLKRVSFILNIIPYIFLKI